jgi:hypothetical protein
MSFISSENHPNPDDPLYYAPRSVRSEANLRPNSAPHRSEDRFLPTTTRSQFDEMREEAFAKSMRHPLVSDFVYERRQPRLLLAVASRFAAAIGVFAIVGFLFFILIPKSQGSDPPTSAGAAKVMSEESQALLQKFVQFRKSQGSNNPEPAGAAQTTPEESHTLLQKFVQWQQKR